jgi:type IV pilus assembly protein PilC
MAPIERSNPADAWNGPGMFGKIAFSQLSVFCGNVATCLSSGLGVPESLRTSVRYSPHRGLKPIAEAAAERVASGMELSEALQPDGHRFPAFFLPVVRCGEESGRLDEAFAYLGEHCALLVKPSRLVRDTWLFPILIVAAGSIITIGMVTAFAPRAVALAYAGDTLAAYAIAAIVAAIALTAPQIKALFDRAKLAFPVLRETECDLATNRFFHALNLVYRTGGPRVETMIRLAARSIANRAIRDDLVESARRIEAGATIADAFTAPKIIPEEYKEMVRTGDEAGRLEQAFATICRLTVQSLEHRLTMFNAIFLRILGYAVVASVAGTALWLAMSYRPAT